MKNLTDMLSYANGEYVSTEKLAIPIASDIVGTIRGYRIFTACRTIGNKVFHLDDHIDRLFNSASAIYMELSQTKAELKGLVEETVAKNRPEQNGDLLIEIIYSGGAVADNGVAPIGPADLYIVVFSLKSPPDRWYREGMKLASFPYQRQWPEVKLLNYVGAVLAHQTVVKKFGADQALFISPDEKKIVLEGTTFNFFIVRGNTVVTHPLDGRILEGITRKVLLQLIKQTPDVEIKEDYFSYDDLKTVDEAFIASSTRNVVPVVKVDDIVIGNGKPGVVTEKLGEVFKEYLKNYSLF
jgi:branched-chain amino acid aminotransferase